MAKNKPKKQTTLVYILVSDTPVGPWIEAVFKDKSTAEAAAVKANKKLSYADQLFIIIRELL